MSSNLTLPTSAVDPRISKFRKLFVRDELADIILQAIGQLHRVGRGTTHAFCMGLLGPSGSGKTRLARRYEAAFMKTVTTHVYVDDGLEVGMLPILYVECPARATIKGVAETLLRALEDLRPSHGTQDQMTQRVKHLLRMRRVSLIIMDEFQHLVARTRSNDVIYDTANWIKNLLNENICPILLVGTEAAAEIFKINEQLQRRALAIHKVHAYSISGADDFTKFQDTLRGLEQALGMPLPSDLADENLARRIFLATDGLIGRITRLLDCALLMAIERGENCISRQTLHDSYQVSANALISAINPFSSKASITEIMPGLAADNSRRLRAHGRADKQPKLKDIIA